MPHIHTEPGQHDHTASAYIVRQDIDNQLRLLLHMHRKLGVLLQPGGHVELDETPWQSVAHELIEETGYDISELKILQPLVRIKPDRMNYSVIHPQPFSVNTHRVGKDSHYHTDSAYIFSAAAAPSRPPAEGESTDLRWLSEAEIAELPDDIIMPDTRELARAALTAFYVAWQPVDTTEFDR